MSRKTIWPEVTKNLQASCPCSAYANQLRAQKLDKKDSESSSLLRSFVKNLILLSLSSLQSKSSAKTLKMIRSTWVQIKVMIRGLLMTYMVTRNLQKILLKTARACLMKITSSLSIWLLKRWSWANGFLKSKQESRKLQSWTRKSPCKLAVDTASPC